MQVTRSVYCERVKLYQHRAAAAVSPSVAVGASLEYIVTLGNGGGCRFPSITMYSNMIQSDTATATEKEISMFFHARR